MKESIILILSMMVSGLLILFIINKILNGIINKKISEIEEPITINIMKLILFTCGGLLLGELITSFQVVIKILPNYYSDNSLLLQKVSFFSIFLGIILITFLINFWLSSFIFSLLSKGKRIFYEVANNNISSILLFGGIILALTFASKPALPLLFDVLIPYPQIPNYR